MYEFIIFDFFDVIHSDPFHRWLRKHDYKREGEFEESSRQVDRGHISELEFYQQLSTLSNQSVESVQEVFSDTELIDKDMVALVKRLHASYKTGLLSNASGEYLRPILKKHHMAELFDEVVISAEVGLIKPSPEIFEYILKRAKVEAKKTIFIDDNPRNTSAAAELGIYPIVFTSQGELEEELAKIGVIT